MATNALRSKFTRLQIGERRKQLRRSLRLESLEDRRLLAMDFGDAPAPYPTLLQDSGPAHVAVGPYLGIARDSEADGQPARSAVGDDLNVPDEDGVTFGPLQVGQSAIISLQIQNVTTEAFVDAWIDFDGDGTWAANNERIASHLSVEDGTNEIQIQIPVWAVPGQTVSRFRISSTGGLATTGIADDGEVEDHQVTILPAQRANGNFSAHAINTSDATDSTVITADLDGDGDADVIGADAGIFWHTNDGTGTLGAAQQLVSSSLAKGIRSLDIVDFDGDGDLDMVAAARNDGKINWYENDGSLLFTRHILNNGDNRVNSIATIDVDLDGDYDVVAASELDNMVAWYENDGSQGFVEHQVTTNALTAHGVVAADYDRDGDVDFLAASLEDDTIAWFENDGSQVFTEHVVSDTAVGVRTVRFADMDGDDRIDIVAGMLGGGKIAWYKLLPNGDYAEHLIATQFGSIGTMIVVDIDGDLDMDVLSASQNENKVSWHQNNNGSFLQHDITTTAKGAIGVAAGDVDGDGDLDILSTSFADDALTWYENRFITSDAIPPTITADLQFNGSQIDPPDLAKGEQPTSWSEQRSSLQTIDIRFSEEVIVTPSDIHLINLGVNAPVDSDREIPLSNSHIAIDGSSVSLTFGTYELPEGVYALELSPTITDLNGNLLDANGDGIAGDGFSIVGNEENRLFRLDAEFSGDGGVSVFD
ncbi:MAG: hypothetical protein ACI9HK_004083, partial [Pirellulaceae bacterium]